MPNRISNGLYAYESSLNPSVLFLPSRYLGQVKKNFLLFFLNKGPCFLPHGLRSLL